MVLDRTQRDEQPIGDLSVGQSSGQQRQDFVLTRSQTEWAASRCLARTTRDASDSIGAQLVSDPGCKRLGADALMRKIW